MSWLKEFENDIIALEQVHGDLHMMHDLQAMSQTTLRPFFEAITGEEGLLKEEVPDEVWNKLDAEMWKEFGVQVIESEKQARPIRLRLTKLYERLADATDAEWEAYAQMTSHARISYLRQSWREIAQRMNEERRKDRELLKTASPAGRHIEIPLEPSAGGPDAAQPYTKIPLEPSAGGPDAAQPYTKIPLEPSAGGHMPIDQNLHERHPDKT